jgi:hypothetical protein
VAKSFRDEDELRVAVESRVSKALEPGANGLKRPSKQKAKIQTAVSSLSEKLKLPVTIKGDDTEGKITISYQNREELERVIRMIQESNLG